MEEWNASSNANVDIIDLNHLVRLFDLFESLLHKTPVITGFAIFYRDIIYNTRAR